MTVALVRKLVGGAWRWVQEEDGGSPTRNVGQTELDFNGLVIGSNATAAVPFTFGDGDEAMIDLTDPAVPFPVADGIYAYTLTVSAEGGSGSVVTLVVDDDYYSINAVQFQAAGTPATTSVTWFSTAGSAFHAAIHSDAGDTYHGSLYVQKD